MAIRHVWCVRIVKFFACHATNAVPCNVLITSTSSSARQSSFFTCGCFCVRGLIHHKPFLETSRQAGHILLEGRTATTPGTSRPTLYEQCVGGNFKLGRYCETGPTVYSPYPRRLESLTICWCNYKGSTFILSYFKTLSVGPAGVELTTSRVTARCSTNWANGARYFVLTA